MKDELLKIATRQSPLALWQANYVKTRLQHLYPILSIELMGMTTEGDRDTLQPLTDIGGKLLFAKELQQAVLKGNADIAVHCVKDLSVQPVSGLCLAAICEREDPRDVLVSHKYKHLDELPEGAVVGTGSPRRVCQLAYYYNHLDIRPLRGNVGTRLQKLDDEEFDAIILAAAGLKRLGLKDRIACYLPADQFIPAIGQGALGIECLDSHEEIIGLLEPLHHEYTAVCVGAERAVNKKLNGDCHTPIGAHAVLHGDQIHLDVMVGSIDGKKILHDNITGNMGEAERLGAQLANELINMGARDLF